MQRNMTFLASESVFSKRWENFESEIKLEALRDEHIGVVTGNSILPSENTTSNEANIILSLKNEKLQPELVEHIERLPIVFKAENAINAGRLNYSSEDDKDLIEESQNEANFSFKRHVKIEPSTTDIKEEVHSLSTFRNGKYNEKTIIKEEHFVESKVIVQEEVHIKDEVEGDQFTTKYIEPEYEESQKTFLTCKYCYVRLKTLKCKNLHENRCRFGSGRHFKGKVFECSYCKLLYTTDDDKNQHQAKCQKRRESKEYEEKNTKKGERKYFCDKCDYVAQKRKYFVNHIRIHHRVNAPKHSCNQCPYQTIHKSTLKTHLRTHNSYGLICILCQKSFKQKSHLDAHYISRHPDGSDKWGSMITSKINECPKCPYKTVITNNFQKHLAIHGTAENQAQFKCNFCTYKCIQKSSFIRHSRLHVGQQPFECTECDRRFNQKVHLDGHIISRHSENEELISSVTSKVHQCDKCGYKSVRNFNFKNHLKTCL